MLVETKPENVLQVIRDIIKNPLLHLPFAGNIVSVMKPAMLESDIHAFPILCLTGEPQSGKSTVARTIVLDSPDNTPGHHINDIENRHFYIITDISVSKLKKILQKRPCDYVVLDDFAVFQDSDSRRKSNRFLDETVRPSFAGTSAMLLLTAETSAFNKITGSLHSRMVMLPMDDWKSNTENKFLLEAIYHIRPILSKLLQEFSEWANRQSYDIRSKSLDFQQKYHDAMDDRSADIFFAYDFSMEEFSKFLEERHGMSFSMDVFRASYMAVWKKNLLRTLTDEALVKHLFSGLINDGAFECSIPQIKQLCQNYCRGICSCSNMTECQGNQNDCASSGTYCSSGNYYDPYELILDNNYNSALLVTDMAHIYGMPKFKQLPHTPLFIVGRNTLLNMLNNSLERFCLDAGISHDCFSPNRLSTLLSKNSMCVARASGDHPCYTFPYMAATGDPSRNRDSVYILRITAQEYRLININNRKTTDSAYEFLRNSRPNRNRLYQNYRNMPQILLHLCKEMLWKYESKNCYSQDQYKNIGQEAAEC